MIKPICTDIFETVGYHAKNGDALWRRFKLKTTALEWGIRLYVGVITGGFRKVVEASTLAPVLDVVVGTEFGYEDSSFGFVTELVTPKVKGEVLQNLQFDISEPTRTYQLVG